MREEEAKTKTCHRTLVPLALTEVGSFYNSSNCIASQCMAWRWGRSTTRVEGPLETAAPTRVDHGFCGLAGGAS